MNRPNSQRMEHLRISLLMKLILISLWCLSSQAHYLPLFLNPHQSVRRQAFLGFWRFSIKVCDELKVTCHPILHSIGCFSCGETVCPLSCASDEAYHFTSTCRHWPAHGMQNKTLSVCSSVESCPVCAWPGGGLGCLSKFNPCHFTFNAHAHRNLTFISE